MVDLCHGPHLPNTSHLKAVGVTNVSRAFWRADVTKEPLQRVYAITFPDKVQLKEYQTRELWEISCMKVLPRCCCCVVHACARLVVGSREISGWPAS
jgi:hypothetical protein